MGSPASCDNVSCQWVNRRQGMLGGKALQSRGKDSVSSESLSSVLDTEVSHHFDLGKLPPLSGFYSLLHGTKAVDLSGRPSGIVVRFAHSTSVAQGSLVWILGLGPTHCSSSHTVVAFHIEEPEWPRIRIYNYTLGHWGEKKKKRKIGNRY